MTFNFQDVILLSDAKTLPRPETNAQFESMVCLLRFFDDTAAATSTYYYNKLFRLNLDSLTFPICNFWSRV